VRVFAVLLAVTLCGCSNRRECDGTYTIDPAFTSDERAIIVEQLHRWGDFTASRTNVKLEFTDVCHISPVDSIPDHGGWGGLQLDSSGNIVIAKWVRADPSMFERTVLHELGHGFGLQHVVDPNAVMNHDVAADVFNDSDRGECLRVGACR